MNRDDRVLPPLIAAQKEMRTRERLIWADRPVRGTALRKTVRGVLSGVFFCAIALFWSGFAFLITSAQDTDLVFRLFPFIGGFFFLVGLAIVVGALRGYRRTGSMLYALSDRRLVIVTERPHRNVRDIDLASITGVTRNERGRGWGDLIITYSGGVATRLIGVPEIGRVAAEIERLRGKAKAEARAAADRD